MPPFLLSRVKETILVQPVFQPQFFRLSSVANEHSLEQLLAQNPHIQVFDQLQSQLEELVKSLNPSTVFSKETLQEAVKLHLDHTPAVLYGVWVYYPWSGRLVHLLDEEEFIFLRTSRNQYKITPEEQHTLSTKKIGVVGLSVGQSVAVTMSMERLFGEIRLADFDLLELTNLNRIRTGVHNLGLPKAISVAREILEIDPFLKVICYTDGLTEANMDRFFLQGGKLDLLVEECDSIDIKILCRHQARALQIPVVMETSDRGMLDVERFDREPDRKILHGLIDHLDLEKLKTLKTSEEKLPYMLPVVGFETISTRLKASALEIGQTITTWPQLASAVSFGGGLAADVARRILLDHYHQSGRYHADMEELVGDPPTDDSQAAHQENPMPVLSNEEMHQIADSLAFNQEGFALSEDTILELVTHANLAPSSGNRQPWKWLYRHNRLFLFLDRSRSYSFWDVNHAFGYLGLGAALENLILKTRQLGYEVQVRHFPKQQQPALVAVVSFSTNEAISTEPSSPLDGRLAEYIPLRTTNRSMGEPVMLPKNKKTELYRALETIPGVELQLIEHRDALTELAAIVTACERIRLLHPEGHRNFFQNELRWTLTEAEEKRDGVYISDYNPVDRFGYQLIRNPTIAGHLCDWQKGKALGRSAGARVAGSSAVGLISVKNDNPAADFYLRSGQALQRLWLAANSVGLAFQPVQAPVYALNRFTNDPKSLPAFMTDELTELLPRFTQVFALPKASQPVFLFRLCVGDAPRTRFLRRPVEDTLVLASQDPLVTNLKVMQSKTEID